MWLASAVDGDIQSTDPPSIKLPSGLESGQQLTALLDECERVLRSIAPEQVVILDPESNNRLTFAQTRGRVTGETILSLAAARLGIACDFMSRKSLRSKLGIPASGKLPDLADSVVSTALKPNWKEKRDLAALAALAGQGAPDA